MNITDDQEDLQKSVKKQNEDLLTFFTKSPTAPLMYFKYTEDSTILRKTGNKNIRENLAEKGKKETDNKVDYGEIDWDYIDSMALRMRENTKYPPENWKKPMDIKELAKSVIRHARKILQPIEGDEETLEEHAVALGCNGFMINYQLKNK